MITSNFLRLLVSIFASTTALAQTQAQGVRIVQTNDDGWAVANIRAQNTALVGAGYDVVLSAPAENKSGTGSSDAEPEPLGEDGCQFESCPPNSPSTGSDPENPRFNYVNCFPVTSVRFGIQTVAPKFFDGAGPALVVAGPNVGTNLGSVVLISGTVGAATEAAKEGFPSLALSGTGGSIVSYTTLSTPSTSTTTADVFASLGLRLTNALLSKPFTNISGSSPILPRNVTLNVNYPAAEGDCTDADNFKFVLTRINAAESGDAPDVETCGSTRLPTESSVVERDDGCFVSVSVMNATNKGDVDATTQGVVLDRLGDFVRFVSVDHSIKSGLHSED